MPALVVTNTTPSQGNSGYGAQFWIGAGSPVVYTAVLEVASINNKKFSVPAIDTTHLQSPNATEEMYPGIKKPGTIELTGNWTGDASQIMFDTLSAAQTVFPYQLTAGMQRDTKTATATGYCFVTESEDGPYEANKKIDFKVTLQKTGPTVVVIA